MRIKHWLTFTGPAFVPVSTDETSARETTSGTEADVGVAPNELHIIAPDPVDIDTFGIIGGRTDA